MSHSPNWSPMIPPIAHSTQPSVRIQQRYASIVDHCTPYDSICDMPGDWRTFFRRSDRTHILEAKLAEGGEHYGRKDMRFEAERGQWICRNPENGYCWVMDEEGMDAFYMPKNRDDEDWKALQKKLAPLKAERKKKQKQKQKQKQSSR